MAESNIRSFLDTTRTTDKYMFFHKKESPLSQWHPSTFKVGKRKFNCAEQYYMFCKAKYFGDNKTAESIMKDEEPGVMKYMGRHHIDGFNDEEWDKVKYGIVVKGNIAKFTANRRLGIFLKTTRGKILVEASPTDCVWGIGLGVWDRRADDSRNWRGSNLLGRALMEVRDQHIVWE